VSAAASTLSNQNHSAEHDHVPLETVITIVWNS
jgi:hypothetical protein